MLNAKRWFPEVKNGVAIRADRSQVFYGIDKVFTSSRGNRLEMVNMDATGHTLTVRLPKRKTARETRTAVMLKALFASNRISLIGCDDHGASSAFNDRAE